ncbi:hypothetical protein PCASD_07893 [Puccinia coronata f. sp. avenae]|uniref:TPX2 C-terminal domain-containing protein n=1 Tax=Puccinia coronata f. sp. avenae TaxID=200324 RepID=A0A2N5UQ07_9BASI|nr:hypothetical protein PCASD_07893 [Puccinia coronata f. sp. avenae]
MPFDPPAKQFHQSLSLSFAILFLSLARHHPLTTMTLNRPSSSLSIHSTTDDQRLQFHRQLMGRTSSNHQLEPHLATRQSVLGINTSSCSFIDPLRNSTTDLSPYHHAFFSPASTSTRPPSRSSTHSSTSPLPIHAMAMLPSLTSPASSLSSRHSSSVRGDIYNAASLFPPSGPHTTSLAQFFDPDYEAERVRLAKLEQRRSLALAPPNPSAARNSREGSIRSVHSFRSVGPSRSKPRAPAGRLAPNASTVYRPSPLRSASTPALATAESEAGKKKKRKEMKEEYQKMRAARIEEEKRLNQEATEKYPSQDSPGWFASRFKRPKELPSTTRIAGHGIDDRRSTSQSSATGSTAPSSSPLDDGSNSTVPTSVEDDYQELGQRPKNEELLEDLTDDLNSFNSPPVDPFRKSVLPGQVPPTPTKKPQVGSQTPKTLGRTMPTRINIIKLNRLFDTFKLGGAGSHGDIDPTTVPMPNKDDRRKAKISIVDSQSPMPDQVPNNNATHENQSGWLGSIKSIRAKGRVSRVDTKVSEHVGKRRKSIGGLFFGDREMPPPVPKIPQDLVQS